MAFYIFSWLSDFCGLGVAFYYGYEKYQECVHTVANLKILCQSFPVHSKGHMNHLYRHFCSHSK